MRRRKADVGARVGLRSGGRPAFLPRRRRRLIPPGTVGFAFGLTVWPVGSAVVIATVKSPVVPPIGFATVTGGISTPSRGRGPRGAEKVLMRQGAATTARRTTIGGGGRGRGIVRKPPASVGIEVARRWRVVARVLERAAPDGRAFTGRRDAFAARFEVALSIRPGPIGTGGAQRRRVSQRTVRGRGGGDGRGRAIGSVKMRSWTARSSFGQGARRRRRTVVEDGGGRRSAVREARGRAGSVARRTVVRGRRVARHQLGGLAVRRRT